METATTTDMNKTTQQRLEEDATIQQVLKDAGCANLSEFLGLGRSKGGCVFVGLTSVSQIENTTELFNKKINAIKSKISDIKTKRGY